MKNNYCSQLGKEPSYPGWLHSVSHINHLLLVINSSVNIVIYCLTGNKYGNIGKLYLSLQIKSNTWRREFIDFYF